jgi:hypothetical protein
LAKRIVASYYEVDAANDTIVIPSFVKKEEIYLITDVDTGTIIVNFSDPELTIATWAFNEVTEKTTITTTADLSVLGVSDSSKLQIIVEEPFQEIEVADSLLDPVHKIRVSTPQNLIDTDFEYGLQPTKWETLELSNNIPSFYVADGDAAIAYLGDVQAVAGSDLITVTTTIAHGLVIGSPIDVQGLTSRTAEGKFLIKSSDTTSFIYQANAVQSVTGSIGSIYTTVTPGQFYAGSQITYDENTGITSDGATQSEISVTTPNPHGFVDGANFYLVNTVAVKTLKVTEIATDTAPDGRPYVDFENQVTINPTVDLTKTETKAYRPPHSLKFDATAVNIVADTIAWSNHRMRDNDVVLYVPPSGDTQIGGLDRFDFYYVIKVDDNTISLTDTRDGSAINFTNTGSYNYGRAMIGMVYELWAGRGNYRDSYGYGYTTANYNNGVGSGWDMNQFDADANAYGLSGGASQSGNLDKVMLCGRTNTQIEDFLKDAYTYSYRQDTTNYTFPETNTKPNRWNFIEDEAHWVSTWSEDIEYAGRAYTSRYWRFRKYYWYNGGFRYFGAYSGNRDIYVVPLIADDEADTFFSQNLSLKDGDNIALTITSGDLETLSGPVSTNRNLTVEDSITGGTYQIDKVGSDRFRLVDGGTTQRIREATGTYSWTATTDNPTANTYYIESHGLTEGTNLTIDASLGTLPNANSGQIETENRVTNVYEFSLLNAGMQDWRASTTGFRDLAIPSDVDNGYLSRGAPSGYTDNMQYIRTNAIQDNFRRQYDQTSIRISVEPTDTSSTSIFYPYEGTRHELSYPAYVGTDVEANVAEPFWLRLRKANFQGTDTYIGSEAYMYIYWRSSSQGYTGSQEYRQTYSAANNNYYYAHSWIKNYGNGNTDFIVGNIKIRNRTNYDNNSWMEAYQTRNGDRGYTYNYVWSHEDDMIIDYVFSVEDTFVWDNAIAGAMIEQMIDTYDAGMQFPAFTDATQYSTKVVNNNRIALADDNGVTVDITNAGASPTSFVTDAQVGIVDGAYETSGTTNQGLSFHTSVQIDPVTYDFNGAQITVEDEILVTNGHNLLNGAALVYNNNSNTDITGLINNTTYYAIVVDDVYIKLAASPTDVLNNTHITLTGQTGTHKLASQAISGIAEAQGTVDVTEGSDIIVGNLTLFKRYFKVGDSILIKDSNSTPGDLQEFEVLAVADDNSLQLTTAVGFTSTATKHFTATNLYARPDGYSIHRPFDGGVEIAAGTAPFSSIRRQTRKYFRYQSGKGIQTSVAINFNPPVTFETLSSSGTLATGTTLYPHRMETGQEIRVHGSNEGTYNGSFIITVVDDFTFTFVLASTPVSSIPGGLVKYNVGAYNDASTRVGMFDQQNGFYYEYDGSTIYCVRRTSTSQISGTVAVTKNSSLIRGTGTNFQGQLSVGKYIVIRGQSYKVIQIDSETELYIQPEYRGVSGSNIIVTLTEDIRIPQSEWNIDKCDGTGAEGFNLDIDHIQMAYMDYSWYGAGKIRFGFKDRKGKVRYVHEFIHNNRLDEAYMRSGNMAAAYEVINGENPTYAPTLFHWGTSVIMDGTFDEDEAYLFTATSKSLSFTNGQSITATTTGDSGLIYQYNRRQRNYDIYVRIPFATADAGKLTAGTPMFATGVLLGEEITYTQYSGSTIYAYHYVTSGFGTPSNYPIVPSGTEVSFGQDPDNLNETVNLGTDLIPLVTLRLAPSVDSGISGFLGERDIINRMQLRLSEVGLILTHECEVKLILNGDLSKVNWENVNSPSLSQLQKHDSGEKVTGGVEIFSFRANGGSETSEGARLANSSNFSLEAIIDLGNSILGGDGTFPNGPDILTLAVQVVDTSLVSATAPFSSSGRITWSESQA